MSRLAHRFEELEVWKTARELAQRIYAISRLAPMRNERILQDQMKRAALSISSNIAEGYERGTRKQQIEFCYIAKGSAGELRSQVTIGHDVGVIPNDTYGELAELCNKCCCQIGAYIAHLKRTQHAIPGDKFSTKDS